MEINQKLATFLVHVVKIFNKEVVLTRYDTLL